MTAASRAAVSCWLLRLVRTVGIAAIVLQPFSLSAELQVLRAFSFGQIVVKDAAILSTLVVPASGSSYSTGRIFVIAPGQSGLFRLTGLEPFRTVQLSPQLPLYSYDPPNSDGFEIIAVDMPSQIESDALGEIQFPIGAELRTRHINGLGFKDGLYNLYLVIEITYL